jgi:prevent-host-death family protein
MDSLERERQLLAEARRALAVGPAFAPVSLRRHEADFPNDQLVSERALLLLEVLHPREAHAEVRQREVVAPPLLLELPSRWPLDQMVWSGETRCMGITNIADAKAQRSAWIRRVEQGDEVIIGRAGRPVARLVPFERPSRPRRPGALKGRITLAPDFDQLPTDLAEAFGVE